MRLGVSRIGNWGPGRIAFKFGTWPSAICRQPPPHQDPHPRPCLLRRDVRSSALEPIIMVINRPGNWLLICSLVTNSGRQRAITCLNYSLKINKTPQRQRESLARTLSASSLYFRTVQFQIQFQLQQLPKRSHQLTHTGQINITLKRIFIMLHGLWIKIIFITE